MDFDEEALWFASLDMDGLEEERLSIPKKKKAEKTKEKPFKIGGFVEEMEKYSPIQGEEAPFVSYQHPLPSYDTMTMGQKNWYFYWRTQVRQGIFLPTDPDYVYILAFECLLKVGNCEPETANRILLHLLSEYGDLNGRLKKNLEVWALDFCLQHPLQPTEFLKQVPPDTLDTQSINLIFHKYNQIFPLFLPISILSLHYERKSVFQELERYQLREIVEDIIEKTFESADIYCHTKKNKRLLQIYGTEKKETYSRFCYQSANLLWKKPTLELTVQNHYTYQKIFLFLGFFLDFTLYTLGNLWNIPLSAPDCPLGGGLEPMINQFLKTHFPKPPHPISVDIQDNFLFSSTVSPPEKKVPDYSHIRLEDTIEKLEKARLREKEKRKKSIEEQTHRAKTIEKKVKMPTLQLDFSQIDQLRVSSDAVREALEVLEQKEDSVDLSLLAPVKQVENTENQKKTAPFTLDLSLIDSLRKDSDEVRDALAVEVLEEGTIPQMVEISVTVEHSPEKLEEKVENEPSESDSLFSSYALEGLSPDLKTLCHQLPPHLWKTLSLISQEKWEQFELFAMEQFSMPSLLVDEINGLAVEHIGDILLETLDVNPTFLEEYKVLSDIFKE